jgi:hypothetical protein
VRSSVHHPFCPRGGNLLLFGVAFGVHPQGCHRSAGREAATFGVSTFW